MKTCNKCKQVLGISDFSINQNKSDGLNSWCRECSKEYFREYYKNNKSKHKEIARKNRLDYFMEVAKYKLERGCKVCGYDKCPGALHFHHRDSEGKEFSISEKRSFNKELMNEIDKCDLLCANCHAEQHTNMTRDEYLSYQPTTKKTRKTSRKYSCNPIKCGCGNNKRSKSKRCLQCHRKIQRTNSIINKIRKTSKTKDITQPRYSERCPHPDILRNMVWSFPSTHLGRLYGVSDTMIKKWCRNYEIEKPSRGYWTKIKQELPFEV